MERRQCTASRRRWEAVGAGGQGRGQGMWEPWGMVGQQWAPWGMVGQLWEPWGMVGQHPPRCVLGAGTWSRLTNGSAHIEQAAVAWLGPPGAPTPLSRLPGVQVLGRDVGPYMPQWTRCIDHFALHAGTEQGGARQRRGVQRSAWRMHPFERSHHALHVREGLQSLRHTCSNPAIRGRARHNPSHMQRHGCP